MVKISCQQFKMKALLEVPVVNLFLETAQDIKSAKMGSMADGFLPVRLPITRKLVPYPF
jgi:hypothetical protein